MADNAHALNDDTPIWRYLDLPKFIHMLATGTLWFSRATEFHDDPYEGFCRVTAPKFPADEHGPGPLAAMPGTSVEISFQRFMAEMAHSSAEYLLQARQHLHVNSWCLATESMAMWQIYGVGGTGIAIKSSIGRFRRAFGQTELIDQFAFASVVYSDEPVLHDLSRGSVPAPGRAMWEAILKLGLQKRTCYQFEDEWRCALYQELKPDEKGRIVPFDLDEMIESVLVGPRASRFFLETVETVMEKFGLQKPLRKSALLDPPV